MKKFEFCSPTDVCFGSGVEDRAGEYCIKHGKRNVFLVLGGGSARRSGLLDRVTASLEKEGIRYAVFEGVKPNPVLSRAREGIEAAYEFGADLILGVGGGSALDTAKMISHGVMNYGTDVWDIWTRKAPLTRTLGVACIPTMAAAGSELSDSAVITNEELGKKLGLSTPFNRPLFSLIDPELLYTLPRYQTACGCADIMMHTLERYFTDTKGNYLTDEIAFSVLRTVVKYAPVLLEKPDDYEAASEIFWASELSHNDLTGLGGRKSLDVHKLGMQLSADFDMTHGASLTVLYGAWARHFADVDPERFRLLGERVLGLPAGCTFEQSVKAMEDLFRSFGLPACFSESELGILKEGVIESMAYRVTDGGKAVWGTFAPIGYEDALDIYRRANV